MGYWQDVQMINAYYGSRDFTDWKRNISMIEDGYTKKKKRKSKKKLKKNQNKEL